MAGSRTGRQPPSSPTPALRMTIGDKSIEIVADKEQQDQLVAEFIAALQQD